MLLDKIKYRLIIFFVIVAMLPAVPLSLFFQSMTRKVFSVGYSKRMETALEDGVKLSQQLLDNEIKMFVMQVREFNDRLEVRTFLLRYVNKALTKVDYDTFVESGLFQKYRMDGVAVYDAHRQTIFISSFDPSVGSGLQDSAFVYDALQLGQTKTEYVEAGHYVLVAFPMLLPNQQKAVIAAARRIDSPLAQKAENLFTVLQFYKTFDAERKQIVRSFVYTFILTYSLLIVLSIALGIFFSNIMTRPIQTLVTGTHEISNGNLDYQIDIKPRNDEIGKLMSSFNQMVANIKHERQRTIYLEKMAAWREIAQRMAHEIKNPLTPIQLTVQQIRDAYHGSDEKYRKILQECSEIIEEEIESLKNLTKEFSEFARMPSLSVKSSSLNQLVTDVVSFYAGVPFKINCDPVLPLIEMDPEAMRRVLINLIDNAMAAMGNRPDRLITLTTQAHEAFVRLVISDNGHGIPKDNLSRVFEPHFSTKSTGMGLGLAIVKSILDEHKAEIAVDSVENLGTTFTVDLKKKINMFNND